MLKYVLRFFFNKEGENTIPYSSAKAQQKEINEFFVSYNISLNVFFSNLKNNH